MKELKDIIHLYVGCELVTSVSVGRFYSFTPELDMPVKCLDLFWRAREVKPILRKLEDMTEDEAVEVASLSVHEHEFINIGIRRNKYNDVIVSWGVHGVESFNCTGELFYCAEQFQYLLSKHFDLFGLIPSGLAIDAKTIS